MTDDPRLAHLGPRPPPSAGWVALRDWLRARNAALRVPRFRYPSARCSSCSALLAAGLTACASCGALVDDDHLDTPEAELGLDVRNPEGSPQCDASS